MTEKHIGNYRVLKQIGAGGMAKVYLAVHKDVPNLKVVLKILSNPQHAARFMQEADKLALLERNPNICHIRHFFEHEEELVIAMEYIDGESLETMIAAKGTFSTEETVKIVIDLLAALAFAHEKEIYHRDIKPGNVMFDRDGRLKIIDFGIAKGKADPQMTIVGTATGTPGYMAPEQFTAGEHVDYAKCDIYAVGTMMYMMLAGRLPFTGENEFVLRDAKLFEDPAPPSRFNKKIPQELDRVILKAIDKDPAKRFASVAEMRSALLECAGTKGRPDEARGAATTPPAEATSDRIPPVSREAAVSPLPRVKPSRRRGKRRGIAVAAGAFAVIVAAALFWARTVSDGDSGKVEMPVEDGARIGEAIPAETTMAEEIPAAERDGGSASGTGSNRDEASDRAPSLAAAVKPAGPAPSANGFILVKSSPINASVYINDVLQKETTPYTFDRPPGRYTVKLTRVVDGAPLSHVEAVTLRSGDTLIVEKDFYR